MQIAFKVERNEYIKASELVYSKNSGRMSLYGILGLFFLLDIISSGTNIDSTFWLLVPIFIVIVDTLIFAKISKKKAKTHFKSNEDFLHGPFVMHILDDGLSLEWLENSLKIKWTQVTKSYSIKEVIVIIAPDRAFHIIPKRHIEEDHLVRLKKGLGNDFL